MHSDCVVANISVCVCTMDSTVIVTTFFPQNFKIGLILVLEKVVL